ncbi:unnamed protein product, partial [Porites lobata]
IAKEVSDRAAEGRPYGNLGNIYFYLGDFQRAIEYHKQSLSIAKEVSDMTAEGRAYGNLGKAYHSFDDFQQAIESGVHTYETIRASLFSKDAWKISFRKLCIEAYTYSWQVLIMLQKTDEGLYAAEKGRAQTLLDALKTNYSFTSLLPRTDESEEDVTNICVLPVFLAIQNETIKMWFLRKESSPIFRQAKLKLKVRRKIPLLQF